MNHNISGVAMSREGNLSRAQIERRRRQQHNRRVKAVHKEYRDMRRGKKQSKLGVLLVIASLIVVTCVTSVRSVSLNSKKKELDVTEQQLEIELSNAQQKKLDLEQQQKYMKTKKYIEDEAKAKLGLVYPDEIVIKPREE